MRLLLNSKWLFRDTPGRKYTFFFREGENGGGRLWESIEVSGEEDAENAMLPASTQLYTRGCPAR